MLGKWLQKRNDNRARQLVAMCISTISTRNLSNSTNEAFAGLASAELARAIKQSALPHAQSREARLVTAIFATAISNHISLLINANYDKASYFAVGDILHGYDFEYEFQLVIKVYSKLAVAQSAILSDIRAGCKIWMKDPSISNIQTLALLYRSVYNSASAEPELPL